MQWTGAALLPSDLELGTVASGRARFAAIDATLTEERTWRALRKSADDFLIRECGLAVRRHAALGLTAAAGESPEAFRARCRVAAEARAADEVGALEGRAAKRRAQMEERLRREKSELARDTAVRDARAQEEKLSWVRTAGEAIISLAGGSRSRGVLGKIGSGVARSATQRRMRAGAEHEVAESEQCIAALEAELQRLDDETAGDRKEVMARARSLADEIEVQELRPQKSTLTIETMGILWAPAALAGRLVSARVG
jgi:hypothetical protein